MGNEHLFDVSKDTDRLFDVDDASSCSACDELVTLADIALDVPSSSQRKTYTYKIPEDDKFSELEVGCAVKVSFGKRTLVGYVCNIYRGTSFSGLKAILDILGSSYFDEFAVMCAEYISNKYIAPLYSCLKLFLPISGVYKVLVDGNGNSSISKPKVTSIDDKWICPGEHINDVEIRKNAVVQQAIIDAVKLGDIRHSELAALYSGAASAIKALDKLGAISIEMRRRFRGSINLGNDTNSLSENHSQANIIKNNFDIELTGDQRNAIAEINNAIDKHDGNVVLVDGVTGSGKTEVYLQSIARVLSEGKNAIVLVPEISLTPQTIARLHARFGDTVAVLHSRMNAGERFDQWEVIKSGAARVVVGARSALFAPISNLGLIVIDEEHESTYKQESSPRYDARDVAVWMVKTIGATLVLGSATPSIDSQYCANKLNNWSYVQMPTRVNGKPLPDIQIINMERTYKRISDKRTNNLTRELFSIQLEDAIVDTLSKNQKVVLFLNQRGFARYILCSDCGFVARCKLCSTTLTYHVSDNNLVCHHCGYSVSSPVVCPACKSHYLMKQGFGTERVENELRTFLDLEFAREDAISIVRMDADTTSGKGAHERLLSEFASSKRGVLLGTQMIAKGLDFDDVTLVGVINADTQLNLPDFRASERTFNLIEQVAGRAGRGEVDGKVMVQTYQSDNVAIVSAASYDRDLFLRAELPKRKILGYPPYVSIANVLVWGENSNDVEIETKRLHQLTLSIISDFSAFEPDVLSPVPCVFERIRNVWRWHFIVKCNQTQDLSDLLNKINVAYKRKKGINVAFDVNPQDLL